MMQTWFRKQIPLFIGVIIGAALGLAYWNYIGCASGSCAITSVWYNSTIYGALLGGLTVNIFKRDTKNKVN